MSYAIKEMFYTLQGEGANAGRPAVFCRFAGCNLWSGREVDRAGAVCNFCDTDFVGVDGENGGRFDTAFELAARIASFWPKAPGARPLVVFTGGEPMLQLDDVLIDAMHAERFEIAVETNGTLAAPANIDWICVSPKADAELALRHGQELKLVYPQPKAMPERFEDLDFEHFYLQPMDGPDYSSNVQQCISYCLAHPRWKLSLQTHKITGIP